MKIYGKKKNNTIISLICGIIVLFASCKSDIEKVNLLEENKNYPDQSLEDAEIIYNKNGQVDVILTARKINRYTTVDEPHTIFPDGLVARFYDSTQTMESKFSANYAIYHESDELLEAKNNVVAINNKGDTLNTEYLIWYQEEEVIYTDRYVRITTPTGIIHGKGFESNQNFTNWEIKETSGTIQVEEDEEKR
jgi:LPS export ABC transporter protein LptC